MKRSLLSIVLVAGICGIALAEPPSPSSANLTQAQLRLIEKNLVVGLESGIPSLQASAALVLHQVKSLAPDYDFSLCIIPLMHIVRTSGYDVEARLASAVALHALKSERGDFAIARIARFEDNARVRRVFTAMAFESGLEHNLN
jgi:hypothetical protein